MPQPSANNQGRPPSPAGQGLAGLDGVLALDARPECRRHILEVRRPPLEKSVICIQWISTPLRS
jgi:predicted ATPase with chaperone activity